MHHDFLFIITHLNPHLSQFLQNFDDHSQCVVSPKSFAYSSPTDLMGLEGVCEKTKDARVCIDCLTYNHAFQSKALLNICKFLYFIDDPLESVSYIVENGYAENDALSYYGFRLQRMGAMYRMQQGCGIFLSKEIDSDKISSYLELKTPLVFKENKEVEVKLLDETKEKALKIYSKFMPF